MKLLKKIYKYVTPYKGRLTLGILSMLLHSFLTVYVVKVFKDLMETVISTLEPGKQGLSLLTWSALVLIAAYFLKEVVYS
ncbi:MAG TPA: ABC transporter ATP-binding protein, partial [Firmicutes bacterium]|nr:ABC transporter ATP-binding protein [Bacillota bacterium]